jgi:hypothetical protein
LAGAFALVDLPGLEGADVVSWLTRIVEKRLVQADAVERSASRLLAPEAMQALVPLYEESGFNLRETLAALQSACEYAFESEAEIVGPGRVQVAAADWRERNRS